MPTATHLAVSPGYFILGMTHRLLLKKAGVEFLILAFRVTPIAHRRSMGVKAPQHDATSMAKFALV